MQSKILSVIVGCCLATGATLSGLGAPPSAHAQSPDRILERQPPAFDATVGASVVASASVTYMPAQPATITPGQNFRAECPAGSFLVGFSGRVGRWIDQLAPMCAPLSADKLSLGPATPGVPRGTSAGGVELIPRVCSEKKVLGVGKSVRLRFTVNDDGNPKDLKYLLLDCEPLSGNPSFNSSTSFGLWQTFDDSGSPVYSPNEPQYASVCPKNQVATGFHGRLADFIKSFGLICGPLRPAPPLPPTSFTRGPNNPTIMTPRHNGWLKPGNAIIRLVPHQLWPGEMVALELNWVDAPPPIRAAKRDFFAWEVPLAQLESPAGYQLAESNLSQGRWRMRARISQPDPSDWSPWVDFGYGPAQPKLLGRASSGVLPLTTFPVRLYGLQPDGLLKWYQHNGSQTGQGLSVAGSWTGPVTAGSGWQIFKQVIAGGYNLLYAIQPNGDLLWYYHFNAHDGKPNWHPPQKVGTGWQHFTQVFSAHPGVLYALSPDGVLRWYRHKGAMDGKEVWADAVVANDMNRYSKLVGVCDGIIYMMEPNGFLFRQQHLGYRDGSSNWGPRTLVGRQWNQFSQIAASCDGILYGIDPAGNLKWYKHLGYKDGSDQWAPERVVGTGWNMFTQVLVPKN